MLCDFASSTLLVPLILKVYAAANVATLRNSLMVQQTGPADPRDSNFIDRRGMPWQETLEMPLGSGREIRVREADGQLLDQVLAPLMGWVRNYHAYMFFDRRDGAAWGPKDSNAIDCMHMCLNGF